MTTVLHAYVRVSTATQMDLSNPSQVVLMGIQQMFNWFENPKWKERLFLIKAGIQVNKTV